MKQFKYLVLGIALTTSVILPAQETELAKQLLPSYHGNQLTPLISASAPDLSLEQAYVIQRDYVKQRLANQKPAGFKAGLTSTTIQKKFGLNQAVVGVLFSNGDLSANRVIQLSQFQQLHLETEIGFEIGTSISTPITNQTEFKQNIRAVLPVIELPDSGFANKPKAIDIIAANVGSAAYLKGKPVTHFKQLNLNALKVTLTQNGKIVNTGQGYDTLGDQWQAALWLVNTLVAQGWTLIPGQLLLTGAIGKMVKAELGDYQAHFEQLEPISFAIVP